MTAGYENFIIAKSPFTSIGVFQNFVKQCVPTSFVNWYDLYHVVLLKNMVTSADSYLAPAVFLKKFEEVPSFIVIVSPPHLYYNTYIRICQYCF